MSFMEEAWQLQLAREEFDAAVCCYAPKLAGRNPDIADIYRRLCDVEEKLVPSGDYVVGSARVNDELLVLHGLSRVLLTAEHATIQQRRGRLSVVEKEADIGTGALAEVTAQDTNATAIIAIGRQTGDPNWDPGHPLKNAMAEVIKLPQNRAHLSLHMLNRGRASEPTQKQGYSILLGIGNKPSEATLALKDSMVEIGSDLELKISVNQPHINFDEDHKLILNDDGTPKTITFAGAGLNTTRSFSEKLADALGKGDNFAAIQVEINEVLLKLQNDEVAFPAQTDRELGTYLGYLFVKRAAQAVGKL